MDDKKYPTDLSDDEWRCIRPHLPGPTGQGRPRLHGLRAILDAVFYVLKSGCPWRWLPREFPPWKTVYDWFRRWRIDGTWERLNVELRGRLEDALALRQEHGHRDAVGMRQDAEMHRRVLRTMERKLREKLRR